MNESNERRGLGASMGRRVNPMDGVGSTVHCNATKHHNDQCITHLLHQMRRLENPPCDFQTGLWARTNHREAEPRPCKPEETAAQHGQADTHTPTETPPRSPAQHNRHGTPRRPKRKPKLRENMWASERIVVQFFFVFALCLAVRAALRGATKRRIYTQSSCAATLYYLRV